MLHLLLRLSVIANIHIVNNDGQIEIESLTNDFAIYSQEAGVMKLRQTLFNKLMIKQSIV